MIQDPFEGAANDDGALAFAALSTHTWLLNARFAYEDLRVKIPIMYQEDGNVLYILHIPAVIQKREKHRKWQIHYLYWNY